MEIILKEINRDNWEECIELQVEESQRKFVASNYYSLLESKYEDYCYPMGIYDGEAMVGFLMYSFDEDTNKWWMCRLMMDKKHQGRGYGKKSIELFIDLMKKEKGNITLCTSFEPENTVADKLYESIGFRKTGEIAWGEVVMEIQL
ncbi:GNAT family N-acetyltransferase [Clostridium sp. UBA6640]|uniref:GNAT family N-acetyltransferase n=1 Tax=Clostridium sp. UBA6640 TaxID=1946370 RepID=UPI0025BD7096|nr:GNAT family N-acetyltransferase [Clostridium sp. UBA6640]